MSDLVQSLQSQTGLGSEQVEGGLGALFDFLKSKLSPELFSSLESALPQARGLIQTYALKAEAAGSSGGGLLGTLGGLAGKLFGGKLGDLSELADGMGKVGLSLDQVKDFLPKALAMLKQVLPDELVQKLLAAVPGLEAMLQTSEK